MVVATFDRVPGVTQPRSQKLSPTAVPGMVWWTRTGDRAEAKRKKKRRINCGQSAKVDVRSKADVQSG